MAVRLFIAFDTPGAIRKNMAELQTKLRESGADVRWEPTEKFHATIKFLGNTEENAIPSIAAAIGNILQRRSSFEVTYKELGCFPRLPQGVLGGGQASMKRPRVIWIGCENNDGTLANIKIALDDALLPFGFAKEDREFHPHVTLGRVKSSRGLQHLTPLLQTLIFEPRSFHCTELLLMKSTLKLQGSEYSVVQLFPLQ